MQSDEKPIVFDRRESKKKDDLRQSYILSELLREGTEGSNSNRSRSHRSHKKKDGLNGEESKENALDLDDS